MAGSILGDAEKEKWWDRSSPFFELIYQMSYFVGLQVSSPYYFKVSSHWILYCLLCPSKTQAPEKQGIFVLNSFTPIYWSITDLKCTIQIHHHYQYNEHVTITPKVSSWLFLITLASYSPEPMIFLSLQKHIFSAFI